MSLQETQNKLLTLNVNEYTEKKNGLTYLSWANAWQEVLKVYPDAEYDIKKDENGIACFGNSEMGYMVYTTVTIENKTKEMWLSVMDYRNKAILKPTTTDVNKSIMRCLTKNLAMFGLGLYIYAGEDLPEEDKKPKAKPVATDAKIEEIKKYMTDTAFSQDIATYLKMAKSKYSVTADQEIAIIKHFESNQ